MLAAIFCCIDRICRAPCTINFPFYGYSAVKQVCMIGKMRYVILLCVAITGTNKAMAFRPALSLLVDRTITKNESDARSGIFDIYNRRVNLGFELSNKFYVVNDYFIRAGFRYNSFKTYVGARNQVPSLLEQSGLLYWVRGYESFTMPAQLGKDFSTGGGNKGDIFAGVSAGLYNTSSETVGVSSGTPRNLAVSDAIRAEVSDVGPSQSAMLYTADAGVNYQPFHNAPRLTIGLYCSVQLNKTFASSYHGVVTNETTGKEYRYDLSNSQSHINTACSISYAFGKERQKKERGNKLDCPK